MLHHSCLCGHPPPHEEISPLLILDEPGSGLRPAKADEVIRAARALLAQRVRTGVVIQVADQVKDFLRADLGPLEHEQFSAFMLDAQHRLIAYRRLFRGALTETSVHAREVVKEALSCNAAAVILCHNLPSGRADASESDVALTRLLQAALELVDVKVIDHLIVGGHEVSSFAEDGLL